MYMYEAKPTGVPPSCDITVRPYELIRVLRQIHRPDVS